MKTKFFCKLINLKTKLTISSSRQKPRHIFRKDVVEIHRLSTFNSNSDIQQLFIFFQEIGPTSFLIKNLCSCSRHQTRIHISYIVYC
jgi:hypothetical protein